MILFDNKEYRSYTSGGCIYIFTDLFEANSRKFFRDRSENHTFNRIDFLKNNHSRIFVSLYKDFFFPETNYQIVFRRDSFVNYYTISFTSLDKDSNLITSTGSIPDFVYDSTLESLKKRSE